MHDQKWNAFKYAIRMTYFQDFTAVLVALVVIMVAAFLSFNGFWLIGLGFVAFYVCLFGAECIAHYHHWFRIKDCVGLCDSTILDWDWEQ